MEENIILNQPQSEAQASLNGKAQLETANNSDTLSVDVALSRTGGAQISFYYFQKYEKELREKTEEFYNLLEEQRESFQDQLTKQRESYVARIQTLENERKECDDKIVKLSIAKGFYNSLTWVNVLGATLALIGASGASFTASNGHLWITVLFIAVSVIGSLFSQIVTWLSEIRHTTK